MQTKYTYISLTKMRVSLPWLVI